MISASEDKAGSGGRGKSKPGGAAQFERPTETAVALRYEAGRDPAPKVVAAGQGEIAKRILETARQHDIPVYAEPDLAEVLSRLDLGTVIPPETYAVVAKIMAFVYGLDRAHGRSADSR